MKVIAHRIWTFDMRAGSEVDGDVAMDEDGEEDGSPETEGPEMLVALTEAVANVEHQTHQHGDVEDEEDEDDVEPDEEYLTRLITSRTTTLDQAVQIFNASRDLLGIGHDDEILGVKLEGEANHVLI